MPAFLYILASRSENALYVGSTTDLRRRLAQHQAGVTGAHTAKYRIRTLVYFEEHSDIRAAREREHRVKRWRRA